MRMMGMVKSPARRTMGIRRLWRALASSLAPSWRLFDDVTHTPILQLRASAAGGAATEWRTAPMMAPAPLGRSPWQLLHNPKETARLSSCGLIDRLVAEIADLDDDDLTDGWLFRSAVGHLVMGVVAREARLLGLGGEVEFRIVLARGAVDDDDDDDGLVVQARLPRDDHV